MEVQPDFRNLLALFNARGVEYVIVGGYALAFHGAPRYTGDLDLLVRPDPANAERILGALIEFGFESIGLKLADFQRPETVVQLGVPPIRIDILTAATGVPLEEVFRGRVAGTYGDLTVHFMGRRELVANKRATGRRRDLADLEALGELT
jgi:hypothetical protein